MDNPSNQSREELQPKNSEPIPAALWLISLILAGLLFMSVWLCALAGCRFEKGTAEKETETVKKTESAKPLSYPLATSAKKDSYVPESTDRTVLITETTDAKSAALVDLTTNRVIASKQGDARIYPASMTKVMTLIVACDHITDPEEKVTVPDHIVQTLKESGASVMSLSEGEIIPVRTLLYGLILRSAGDAALVLAEHLAGSENAFVVWMNEKAASLGLTGTHFTNCTGLHDDDHYTTCREMAAIFAYALDNDYPREVLTTREINVPSYDKKDIVYYMKAGWVENFEKYGMSTDLSSGLSVYGGKTGFTEDIRDENGKLIKNHCLVTCARDSSGGNYVLVTAGGVGNAPNRAEDAITIYNAYIDS